MERTLSKKLFEKSQKVIPGGVNSPVRAFSGLGISPMIVKSGDRDMITDHDNFQYIDYCLSWGSLILGHRHPVVMEAIQKQLEKGITFGVATEEEYEIANWITRQIPSCEKVRFVTTGSEAAASVVRLARGFTNRKLLVRFDGSYHGAGESLLSLDKAKGVLPQSLEQSISLPFNDVEAVRTLFEERGGEVALVVVEPIATNMGLVPATGHFLKELRKLTLEYRALLVFDEINTGFRVGLHGAQGLYGIDPDLTFFGKVIGGGFSAAAFGGSREVMDALAPQGKVFQAGTLSGNPVAMAAGLATLKCLEAEDFHLHLKQKTDLIVKPVQEFIQKRNLNVSIQQMGSIFSVFFGAKAVTSKADQEKALPDMFRRFFQFLFVKGIYISPSQMETSYVSAVHEGAHLEKTRDMMIKFLTDFESVL